jgi:PAS domain-containing protein
MAAITHTTDSGRGYDLGQSSVEARHDDTRGTSSNVQLERVRTASWVRRQVVIGHWRGLRNAVFGRPVSEPAATIGLALGMVLTAAVWITVDHLDFAAGQTQFVVEAASDLVALLILAGLGMAIGSRRARALEGTLQALRANEARTRELIEASGDGILVSEASGRYVEVNPALCRMLGYSRDSC